MGGCRAWPPTGRARAAGCSQPAQRPASARSIATCPLALPPTPTPYPPAARGSLPYGYQTFYTFYASRDCFARTKPTGCRELATMRAEYARIGVDTRRVVF